MVGILLVQGAAINLKVWLRLSVWVVFDRLADPFRDRVFIDRHLPLANACGKLIEVAMNACHNGLAGVPGQDLRWQQKTADKSGQSEDACGCMETEGT